MRLLRGPKPESKLDVASEPPLSGTVEEITDVVRMDDPLNALAVRFYASVFDRGVVFSQD
jgi:hypothetical protein